VTDRAEQLHWDREELRRRGHQAIDWVVDYLASIEERSVLSRVEPGEVAESLPKQPPQQGESFDQIFTDLDQLVMPGITHWQHPSWFAFFNSNTSGPSMVADIISSGLAVQGMLWQTSPACTEVETRMMDWLVEMLDLPESFLSTGAGGGVIQDTASSATLCALVAAREQATDFAVDRGGVQKAMTVYASAQAHSSVEKAVRIAGLGSEQFRHVDLDENLCIDPVSLDQAIENDKAAGCIPTMVIATVGTTATTAIDPVAAIAQVCQKHGVWLHVDAAHAGTAALVPEMRWIHDGLEGADSYCFNPHKWMFVGFDCNAFWVRDRKALVKALSVLPDYLRNEATESGKVIDYRDWHIPLGRRFRALKLWFVIRNYGVDGLRELIAEHLQWSVWFEQQVEADPNWQLAHKRTVNLICMAHIDGDDATDKVAQQLNEQGEMFVTATTVAGRRILRVCIGGTQTRKTHVEAAWHRIAAAGVRSEGGR